MKICLLCGGVGGARAALALAENLNPESLTFVVNTGDDFTHLGLEIWPDWDTVVYTLSGLADLSRGWGREDEGTRAMEELSRLQAPDWFHLGDRDLALHVYRHWALQHHPSHDVAAHIAEKLGVLPTVLRLTENSLDTHFRLPDNSLMDFQTWFVKHRGQPTVTDIESRQQARLTPGVLEAISGSDLLLLAPSNPYLSILPMLKLAEVGEAVKNRTAPTWAISPLVGGKAVKGPLDALLAQLSESSGQQAILDIYSNWVDRLCLPEDELRGLQSPTVKLSACRTILSNPEQRKMMVDDLLSVWSKV